MRRNKAKAHFIGYQMVIALLIGTLAISSGSVSAAGIQGRLASRVRQVSVGDGRPDDE